MRLAAQISSIFGGLFGLFSALGVLAFGEPALVGEVGSIGDARLLGLVALDYAAMWIVGGIAISERPQLALPLLLFAAGAGFVSLGWGWFLSGVLLATGALLTIMSHPDRKPRQRSIPSNPSGSRSAITQWATSTLLSPHGHLGFAGGLLYVLIVVLLVFGSVYSLVPISRLVQ